MIEDKDNKPKLSQEQETELSEFMIRLAALGNRESNLCPYCSRRVESMEKIGRSVFLRPCNCRLWQGDIPDLWRPRKYRKISFAFTTRQFKAKSKIVTRRLGWINLKPGEILEGVEKSQGLKKGERVKSLGLIRVKSVKREKLRTITDVPEYGRLEVILEGFPMLSPEGFVDMFIKSHKGATPESEVTRIQYEYI